MLKIRVTPDSELATPEAIEFRIKQIEAEIRGGRAEDLRHLLRRRNNLKARLPVKPGAPISPAVNAALLVSKSDLEEYSNRVSRYESANVSY